MLRFLVVILLSVPAFADGYSFHLRVTDGKSSMLARENATWSAEQLERAAKSRVLSFERVKGARFEWMMLGWREGAEDVRYMINHRGGTKEPEKADITLAPRDSESVAITCHRTRCAVRVTNGEEPILDVTLMKGQSAELPLNADFAFELEP